MAEVGANILLHIYFPPNKDKEEIDTTFLGNVPLEEVSEQIDSVEKRFMPISLPEKRVDGGSAVLLGRLIYCGGHDGNNSYDVFKACNMLDLHSKHLKWESMLPMSKPRDAFTLNSDGSRLYAIGGINYDEDVSKYLDIFDDSTNWTIPMNVHPTFSKLKGRCSTLIANKTKLMVIGSQESTPVK